MSVIFCPVFFLLFDNIKWGLFGWSSNGEGIIFIPFTFIVDKYGKLLSHCFYETYMHVLACCSLANKYE